MKTYTQAVTICEEAGMSLCSTQEELNTGCSTGCMHDLALAWTQDPEEMIDLEDVNMTMQKGTHWNITASIVTKEASATIVARAFQHGLWRTGTNGAQGKLLFLRHGMLSFDVGWVGFMQGSTRIDDGMEHNVGVEWGTDGLQLLVDGKREPLRHNGLRNRFAQDDPQTEFIVGISVGHRVTDGEANGDMSKEMVGTIQRVLYNRKQVRNSNFQTTPKKIR